ncbi:MAG: GNAT family N-acetyltransferase [Moraxella sp.]|nr:GNAT family N-acetyltransferase [Moraxella sp.]
MTDITNSVRLRRATPDDVAHLNTLIQTCHTSQTDWSKVLNELIGADGSYVFCFDDPATALPLACVGVAFCEKTAHVFPYVVTPTLQGKGIGRTMMTAIRTFATRHAKSRGIDHLSLSLPSKRCPSDFVPFDPAKTDQHGFYLFKSPL